MKRFGLILACAMLAGCGQLGGAVESIPAPEPLAQTQIDDRALIAADRSFDLFLDAVNFATDRGAITRGSPFAKELAKWIRKTDIALQAGFHAAEAGHAADYKTAMLEAQAATLELKKLMGSQ